MQIFFLDESGYAAGDWKSEKNLVDQPFHVLAGVSFPADKLPPLYDHIREEIAKLGIEGVDAKKLGKGIEIKARDIARGGGYWARNEAKRNGVRDTFLGSVKKFDGTAFLSIINKRPHSEKYGSPADPDGLALNYIYERFERFLKESEDYGICVHDQNKKTEDDVQKVLSDLNTEGSYIMYHSRVFDTYTIKHQDFTRIVENTFGHSEASLGIQIADFFATQANTFLKDGRPAGSGWWKTLYASLKTEPNGKPEGYGYKEFP